MKSLNKNEVLSTSLNGFSTYNVNGFDPQNKLSFNVHYTIDHGLLHRTRAWFYYNEKFYEFVAAKDVWHKLGRGISPYALNNLFTDIENDIKLPIIKGE